MTQEDDLAGRGVFSGVANLTMPARPGDRGLLPPTRLNLDFCQGKLPVAMDCTLNLIDVRDAALGLERVMKRGSTGRRYLLGSIPKATLTGLRLARRLMHFDPSRSLEDRALYEDAGPKKSSGVFPHPRASTGQPCRDRPMSRLYRTVARAPWFFT
jgi:hypothetical protein